MNYYAHSRKEQEQTVRQSVFAHLSGAAKIAAESMRCAGLENSACLAALTHDLGKYTALFQRYLEGEDGLARGSVIHTFQGCRFLLERFHHADEYASELLAYAVGAHHGLFDCVDENGFLGLQYREKKKEIGYEEAVCAFLEEIDSAEIDRLFSASAKELHRCILSISNHCGQGDDSDTEYCFQIGLLARLLLSAVIEGDRRDTAQFMENIQFPVWPQDMREIWRQPLQYMERKLAQFSADTPIDAARRDISQRCRAFAAEEPGIYRLNVPTGGGKTLSSLRYALAHAERYNKRRVIFTSPLLSILEQNAKVIYDFVGNDALILEHHSNAVQTAQAENGLDERELLTQNWDAPIIITTMVQLLNTMFSGETTAIRRFQALCGSVLVMDEVQTIPPKLLSMFNLTIRFLQEQCGVTVILCSATQPCLERAKRPLPRVPRDMIPEDLALLKIFSRTEIVPLPVMRLECIPGWILKEMGQTGSLLVVCNTKAEAAMLFQETHSPEWSSFHLSAAMCMHHRRDTVAGLKDSLNHKEKTLCISTQVIEAGVDISFERVARIMAGMDSVVQSAGRCNRNKEKETRCPVYVVNCTDENIGRLEEIRRGKAATENLLNEYQSHPDHFLHDLTSNEAIAYYYARLYEDMNTRLQDYSLPKLGTSLVELLSTNPKYAVGDGEDIEKYRLWQAFKTAGAHFSVFDEETVDVVVPYGAGKQLAEELVSQRGMSDLTYRRELLDRAAGYTVSLYEGKIKQLQACGALHFSNDGSIILLNADYYDENMGVTDRSGNSQFLEV